MKKELRFLILEDVEAHAVLVERELRKAKIAFTAKRVETKEAFLEELEEFGPDLILADHSLPSFDGIAALAIVQQRCPDVPFIFVSGAIGEELAIETLKTGATDYVLKHRLSRLVPAVQRALQEAEERKARREAEEALRKAHGELEIKVKKRTAALSEANEELRTEIAERKRAEKALRDSEGRLSGILESAMDAIITIDEEGSIVLCNQAAEKVFRCSAKEVEQEPIDRFFSESFRKLLLSYLQDLKQHRKTEGYMWASEGLNAMRYDGEEFPIEATISHVEVSGQKLFTIILRDINERMRAEAELDKLQHQNVYLEEEIKGEFNFGEIIGGSAPMKVVFRNINKVAATDSTVLLMGETGTGKELVARAIHNSSSRKDHVLVTVNCGAMPAGLVESELFGHERGAFTGATNKKKGRFELADEGTIFLDEVGELPLETQIKLLRVLQEQEFEPVGSTKTLKVNVRVIAATNRDLEEAVQERAFRPDLFYRLNIFPIQIPPLRERMDDAPLLTEYFIDKFSRRMSKQIDRVSPVAMDRLMKYGWAGNVRELANIIERAVILCDGSVLQPAHIGISTQRAATNGEMTTLEDAERSHISKALAKTRGVVGGPGGAAEMLGINRSTLWSRIKKLAIEMPL